MTSSREGQCREGSCPPYKDPDEGERSGDWDEWNDCAPDASLEDVLDAFELDDEPDGPAPEYGDFWLEVEDKII